MVDTTKAFWALDSEFMMSGRIGKPEDVHTIQFSNGKTENTVVLESAQALKDWLDNHRNIKTMYGFVVLPDLGSIEEWLGSEHVSYRKRGSQLIGQIKYGSTKITVYDARPLLQNLGLRNLADCGNLIGYPKLVKPEWLGIRKWQTETECTEFLEYAKADAVITSRIVQWIYEKFKADPELHASAGTLARDTFQMPKRLKRDKKKSPNLSPLELKVKQNCFAGRSEGFVTGFIPNTVYNDVVSLYPCSLVATRGLEITGAEHCEFEDLVLDDLNTLNYGWIDGIFKTENDLWALPLRGKNNFYATGDRISGFYHTFDLAAAKAKVVAISQCYQPIFETRSAQIHNRYADVLLKRLEGKMESDEKMLSKAVLNSLTGKLGQSHPIASTSNFSAYNTVLAHSNLIMSKLFDKCRSQVLAMDTDSIFSQTDMSGKYFELTDGDRTFPIKMDAKGKGDLAFFRSKNYIMRTNEGKYVFGRHGWTYWLEDFLKLHEGNITELVTRKDIKHTLLVREREALKMAKGRWRTKVVTLNLAKLKELLNADIKRRRADYDSYGLVMAKKNVSSRAWNYEQLMTMNSANTLGYPRTLFMDEAIEKEKLWLEQSELK